MHSTKSITSLNFLQQNRVSADSPIDEERQGVEALGIHRSRSADRLFKAAVKKDPRRAYFIGQACQQAGEDDLATRYYRLATQTPEIAAWALLQLGVIAERHYNRSTFGFGLRHREALNYFKEASQADLDAAKVQHFEALLDGITHGHEGVGQYDAQHDRRRFVLHRHWDIKQATLALGEFPEALRLDPEHALQDISVVRHLDLLNKVRAPMQAHVLPAIHAMLDLPHVLTMSERPWLIARRTLKVAALLAGSDWGREDAQNLFKHFMESPLHSKTEQSLINEVRMQIGA